MAGFDQMYEMAAALRAFPAIARPGLVDALGETIDEAVRIARAKAPVRTGFLRSSIHGEPVVVRGQWGLLGHLTADAPYATFVEYGTSRMAPQPFLEPAAEQAMNEFPGKIDAVLEMLP